jgi:hypothetical protein
VATSVKLKSEYEKRQLENAAACDILHTNEKLWRSVQGPDPGKLFEPTPYALVEGLRAASELEAMIDGPRHDGFDVFAGECVKAARSLRSLEWDAIRAEKFNITPEGTFSMLVRNAESLIHRQAAEEARRKAWLEADHEETEGDGETEGADVPLMARTVDRYGLDLDKFKNKTGRLPQHYQRAVQIAGWAHIDEMRTLLEMHYDDVHIQKYRERGTAKTPSRPGDHKVFRGVVNSYRKQLCQRLALPDPVKEILRKPEDEVNWDRLEALRFAIMRSVWGERRLELDEEGAHELAAAMEACATVRRKTLVDEVGPGTALVPEGSRVLVKVSAPNDFADHRGKLADGIRRMAGKSVTVHTRPAGTIREPPLCDFGRKLARKPEEHPLRRLAELGGHTKEELLDRMLLVLWDALFLTQCEGWTARGVANLTVDEVPELARPTDRCEHV